MEFCLEQQFFHVILRLFLSFSSYVCLSEQNKWQKHCHCKSECFYLRSSICPQTKERAREKCPGVSV